MIDLHVHSNRSDGILAPYDLLQLAHSHGITLLALADHDTVAGIDEAIAAGMGLGIQVIAAVELSVAYKRHTDVHLLGYGINHHDPQFELRLANFCERRDRRSEAIVDRINQKLRRLKRQPIDPVQVAALAKGAIGRPHIARILLQDGHVSSMEEAFVQFLVPCNVAKEYFAMDEAIAEIHRLGGLAVLAHPTSITTDLLTLERLIIDLKRLGLDGLEAFNNLAAETASTALSTLAKRHSLLVTGGSDYHGNEPEERLGVVRTTFEIPEECGANLVAALNRHRNKDQ